MKLRDEWKKIMVKLMKAGKSTVSTVNRNPKYTVMTNKKSI